MPFQPVATIAQPETPAPVSPPERIRDGEERIPKKYRAQTCSIANGSNEIVPPKAGAGSPFQGDPALLALIFHPARSQPPGLGVDQALGTLGFRFPIEHQIQPWPPPR